MYMCLFAYGGWDDVCVCVRGGVWGDDDGVVKMCVDVSCIVCLCICLNVYVL